MSCTNIIPTGGVEPTEESLTKWIKAGAYCVGLGSQLFVKDNNGNFNYKEIEKTVNKSINFLKTIK